MSKKRTKTSRNKKRLNKKYSTAKLNAELMPIANDIKSKMEGLKNKFNFDIDFAFKEITMEEIFGSDEN